MHIKFYIFREIINDCKFKTTVGKWFGLIPIIALSQLAFVIGLYDLLSILVSWFLKFAYNIYRLEHKGLNPQLTTQHTQHEKYDNIMMQHIVVLSYCDSCLGYKVSYPFTNQLKEK